MVQPHISRTDEAIHRLAGGRSLLDAALTLQQDRIRAEADEAFAESLARFRENLGGVDEILQESAQTVAARNLAEIESKAADLKHQTVDDLMKSAEWYEKKAQTQIQSLTEKTVEQAENRFREKAGEVSGVFASELDHSSRSFIGHTQTQMEEVVHGAFEQARALFAEAAETTTAAFTDEIQRQARQELDGFGQETLRSLGETRTLLDAARAELEQKVTVEQEAFLRQFQTGMSSAVERGVADANARVKAGMSPLLDSWKSTVDAHASEMRSIYAQMSNQSAEQHRDRLENVSNQWMLATVASLDHQSREAVNVIAAKAAETLRETCAQVFAGVGETLRDRLQQIAAGLAAPEPPMTRSQTAGGSER
jgi:ribosome recycling factor